MKLRSLWPEWLALASSSWIPLVFLTWYDPATTPYPLTSCALAVLLFFLPVWGCLRLIRESVNRGYPRQNLEAIGRSRFGQWVYGPDAYSATDDKTQDRR